MDQTLVWSFFIWVAVFSRAFYTISMKIHFVCTGNTNRSRLAEAYLRSKQLPDVKVSSSGVLATNNLNGALSFYANQVLTEENIIQYASSGWTETTKEILEQNDLVIFMQPGHLDFVREKLAYTPPHYEIWNISDVPTNPSGDTLTEQQEKIAEDEDIFQRIKKKVDELVLKIS